MPDASGYSILQVEAIALLMNRKKGAREFIPNSDRLSELSLERASAIF
ncbi:hypothetical protein QUA30_07250 [Microcoleus sp. Pol14C2]